MSTTGPQTRLWHRAGVANRGSSARLPTTSAKFTSCIESGGVRVSIFETSPPTDFSVGVVIDRRLLPDPRHVARCPHAQVDRRRSRPAGRRASPRRAPRSRPASSPRGRPRTGTSRRPDPSPPSRCGTQASRSSGRSRARNGPLTLRDARLLHVERDGRLRDLLARAVEEAEAVAVRAGAQDRHRGASTGPGPSPRLISSRLLPFGEGKSAARWREAGRRAWLACSKSSESQALRAGCDHGDQNPCSSTPREHHGARVRKGVCHP